MREAISRYYRKDSRNARKMQANSQMQKCISKVNSIVILKCSILNSFRGLALLSIIIFTATENTRKYMQGSLKFITYNVTTPSIYTKKINQNLNSVYCPYTNNGKTRE